MNELELRGYIQKEDFDKLIQYFTRLFGEKPVEKKRLSIGYGDYDDLTIETKIRITNGKVDVTQKVGGFNDANREEIESNLSFESTEDVYNLHLSCENLIRKVENPMFILIQHENYIFRDDHTELKLFRQFTEANEFFAFEIESLNEDTDEASLREFVAEHNLEVAEDYNTKESILKRNRMYNENPSELDKGILIEIIKRYL
jgi:hypothetical protein